MLESVRLYGLRLNLDEEWVGQTRFEGADEGSSIATRLGYRECVSWIIPLLRSALDSGALALQLRRDHKDRCLRQSIWIPAEFAGSFRWFELLPMSHAYYRDGLRGVRKIANMMFWQKRGVLRFEYRATKRRAACVQATSNDLCVYFSKDRPPMCWQDAAR
jgi:hypothetical protein